MDKGKENLQNVMQRLKKIADDLSQGDIDVETGLKKFKEGVALIKICREQLQRAENEFRKLKSEIDIETNEDAESAELR